jgi:hypothetical protein
MASDHGRSLTDRSATLTVPIRPATLIRDTLRTDSKAMRERIFSLTQSEAGELGIGKSTFHYLREKAPEPGSFGLYEHIRLKLSGGYFE